MKTATATTTPKEIPMVIQTTKVIVITTQTATQTATPMSMETAITTPKAIQTVTLM